MHILIPFILRFEAGLPASKLTLPWPALFEEARKTGFSNDPHDAGGATLCGITLSTYRHYCRIVSGGSQHTSTSPEIVTVAQLRAMSADTWRSILKTLYWDRWQADNIHDPKIARILVDWVWASGVHGIRRPQRLLGVKSDGIVGPKTLAALNDRIRTDATKLRESIISDRLRFIDEIIERRPTQYRFRAGWRRRILALRTL